MQEFSPWCGRVTADLDTAAEKSGDITSFRARTELAQLVRVNPKAQALRTRVKRFGNRILVFVNALPHDRATSAVAFQLARSGPGISSNYHAACRGRSRAEFVAKLGVALEEAEETENWLESLHAIGSCGGVELGELRNEAAELRAILNASYTTSRANLAAARQRDKERHVRRSPKSSLQKIAKSSDP